MTTLKLKITGVDMNGFNGREYHPKPSDIGLVVTALGLETTRDQGETISASSLPFAGIDTEAQKMITLAEAPVPDENSSQDDFVYQVWRCLTEDGRLLDLMDFEVEVSR